MKRNLFGIERETICMELMLGSIRHPKPNHETQLEINFKSEDDHFIDFKISDGSSTIYHSFDKRQLNMLMGQLEKINCKLIENKEAVKYPTDEMNVLLKSIVENHYNFSNESLAVPKPKINVFSEGDVIYLSAIDFANNKILLYKEISFEFLKRYKEDKYFNMSFHEFITCDIRNELMLCFFKNDGDFFSQFKYIGDAINTSQNTESLYNLIFTYVYNNISIEKNVINKVMN